MGSRVLMSPPGTVDQREVGLRPGSEAPRPELSLLAGRIGKSRRLACLTFPTQQMSSHWNEQFALHCAAVGYDFDPQYQRQVPHSSDVDSLIAGAAGALTDDAVGAATVGAVPLPLIAKARRQSIGSTAITLFFMVPSSSRTLADSERSVKAPRQGSRTPGRTGTPSSRPSSPGRRSSCCCRR